MNLAVASIPKIATTSRAPGNVQRYFNSIEVLGLTVANASRIGQHVVNLSSFNKGRLMKLKVVFC